MWYSRLTTDNVRCLHVLCCKACGRKKWINSFLCCPSGQWETRKPILPMFKLDSITLKHLFHLESRTVKSRITYFHFNPWIMPLFSHKYNFPFFDGWNLGTGSICHKKSSAFECEQGLCTHSKAFMMTVHMHAKKAELIDSDERAGQKSPAWMSVNLHHHWLHLATARWHSAFLRALKMVKGNTGLVPCGGRDCAVCWSGELHKTRQNCFPLKQTRKTTGFLSAWTFPTDFTQKYIKVYFGVTATCHWKITFSLLENL